MKHLIFILSAAILVSGCSKFNSATSDCKRQKIEGVDCVACFTFKSAVAIDCNWRTR
jgi:PBP1b-binding outer membrane lipoprotein LpoB